MRGESSESLIFLFASPLGEAKDWKSAVEIFQVL